MGPMTHKRPGWETRLAAEVEAAARRPFAWGQHDCATWAADVVAALTGEPSPAEAWRGRYTTALGGARLMRRQGWASLEAGGRDLLGAPLPVALLAQRGDLVLGPEPDTAFGICLGAVCAFIGPEGLRMVPLADCRMAWRI